MENGRVTVILHKHSGFLFNRKPSNFVVRHMEPMLELARQGTSSLRVIHDRTEVFSGIEVIEPEFEKFLQVAKERRKLHKIASRWCIEMKAHFAAADIGEKSRTLYPELAPEAALILETNSKEPRTIVNHFNYSPLEAAIEINFAIVSEIRTMKAIGRGDMKDAVEHAIRYHDHFASSMLIRDEELAVQIHSIRAQYPKDPLVVLRSCNHAHIGELFEDRGIDAVVEVEERERTFRDEAVEELAVRGLSMEERRRLAIMHIAFTALVNKHQAQERPGLRNFCRQQVLNQYDNLFKEIYGHPPHQ